MFTSAIMRLKPRRRVALCLCRTPHTSPYGSVTQYVGAQCYIVLNPERGKVGNREAGGGGRRTEPLITCKYHTGDVGVYVGKQSLSL